MQNTQNTHINHAKYSKYTHKPCKILKISYKPCITNQYLAMSVKFLAQGNKGSLSQGWNLLLTDYK